MDEKSKFILESQFNHWKDAKKELLSLGYSENHNKVIECTFEMNRIAFTIGSITEEKYKANIKAFTKRKDELWEILVPASGNDKQFSFEHHKAWDDYVKSLANGLTIMKTGKGIWFSPTGKEFVDRMIPCRIATNDFNVISKIIDFTLEHYEQEAVMCYKISTDVIIRHANEKD